MLAARLGHNLIVKDLILNHARVNLVSNSGKSALYFASSRGNLEMVQDLVGAKADINIRSIFGTILDAAVSKKHFHVVNYLESIEAL